jgi:signal transduction histidine kinase
MKDELLHTASHDLKSPLAAVNLNLELIRRHGTVADERGAEYLQRIEGSLSWMEKLITDVLDLAKLETGRALDIKLTSLNPVLEAALADFKSIAQNKSISLQVNLQEKSPEVPIDPILLRQALDNLLSNAIKFTEPGGEVTMSADQSPTSLHISVRDSGIGIDPKHVPHLFDRFYRVNHDRTSAVDGTGLGLAIVDRIVTQHGGQVQVTSAPDAGSTFEITLPLALSDSA